MYDLSTCARALRNFYRCGIPGSNEFVIAEIGSDSKPCEELVRIEIHSLMQGGDSLARRLHGLGIFPFDDRDEIEFTRTGSLLQNEILCEAGLRSEKFMGCVNFIEKLLASMSRDTEFIDSIPLCIHP